MHPLTEGVTTTVTPSARWVGLAVRHDGARLDELVDELAARDGRKRRAGTATGAAGAAESPAGT